jgi:hypothetical protein
LIWIIFQLENRADLADVSSFALSHKRIAQELGGANFDLFALRRMTLNNMGGIWSVLVRAKRTVSKWLLAAIGRLGQN